MSFFVVVELRLLFFLGGRGLVVELFLLALGRGGVDVAEDVQLLPGVDRGPHLLGRHLDRHVRVDAPLRGCSPRGGCTGRWAGSSGWSSASGTPRGRSAGRASARCPCRTSARRRSAPGCWSFSAPETISLALAEYWFTSTTSGRSLSSSSGAGGGDRSAGCRVSRSGRVLTIDAVVQELVGHVRRRRQQAAGVVAQVEDHRLGALGAAASSTAVSSSSAGVLGEVGQPQVADLVLRIDEVIPPAARAGAASP